MQTRSRALILATAILGLTLSGCAALDLTPEAPPSSESSPQKSATGVPAIFDASSLSTLEADEGAPVAASHTLVATIHDGEIVVANITSGLQLWSAVPETAPTGLSFASADGELHLLAFHETSGDLVVQTFPATQPGPEGHFIAEQRFPSVTQAPTATPSGLFVSTADGKHFMPAIGEPSALPSNAVGTHNDLVVTASDGQIGAESLRGEPLWSSGDITPSMAAGGSQGRFLAYTNGLVAAAWATPTSGQDAVVLIQAVSGTVLGEVVTESDLAAAQPLLVSSDGRWAVAGGHLIETATGAAVRAPEELSPAKVERGVIFGSKNDKPAAWDGLSRKYLSGANKAPEVFTNSGLSVFRDSSTLQLLQLDALGENSSN